MFAILLSSLAGGCLILFLLMLSLFRTVQTGTNALIFRIVPTAAYMLLRLAYAVSSRAEERIRKGGAPKTDRLDKWAKRIAAQLDRTLPEGRCRPGTALFCGSSTFTYWHNLKQDLRSEQDLPMQNVVNAAFGGSMMRHNLTHFDALVGKRAPAVVVLFCGTNDIATGSSAAEVAAAVRKFDAEMMEKFGPKVHFVYMAITASPFHKSCGSERLATVEAANREIERDLHLDTTHTRWFVDSFAIEPTLADDKYYVADRHHLNDAGHALLGKVLGPIVVKIARAAHRSSSWW
jgi:hypothetical protein